jgi:alpha-1,2-mannosyltransferase
MLVGLLMVAATALHCWYGLRHHFFDLRIYLDAVNWWRTGHPLYDYARPDPIQGQLHFTYPPFAALLMAPLTLLPFPVAATVFSAATASAVVVTTAWLVLPVARRHGWPPWLVLGAALPLVSWLEPIRETFSFGQINLLLIVLILLDLLRGVPAGSRWAGVGIGVATAVKLTPAIFIVHLLLTRQWRVAGTAIATAAGASALAAVFLWRDSWRFWTHNVWQAEGVGRLDRVPNQSMLGALARLVPGGDPPVALWLVLVAAAGGYGLWRAGRAFSAGDQVAALTLAGLVGALCSPVTWSHHLYWFVPALVILVDAAGGRGVDAAGGRGLDAAGGRGVGAGPQPPAPPRAAWQPWRVGWLALAVVTYLTVALALIAVYDYNWLLPGRDPVNLLVANWDVLLMAVLLLALPVRAAPPGGSGATVGRFAVSVRE